MNEVFSCQEASDQAPAHASHSRKHAGFSLAKPHSGPNLVTRIDMISRAMPSPSHPPRILLVEDDMELSTLLAEVLADAGYTVDRAYSVSDAFSSLEGQPFDAAVLDVELGDGVVFPVADLLKHRQVPYVFVSAVYQQVVPRLHQKAPFVSKPYEIADVVEKVDTAIATH